MDSDLTRAQALLQHAKDLRAMAAQETDETMREKLLDLADQYTQLAEKLVHKGPINLV